MEAKDALKLYERAKLYWSENYQDARDDIRFSIGLDHWNNADIEARGDRPSLVINQLPQFIHQVMNDERMNTPSINVIPVKDTDEETAEIFKGLIKNIEYKSNADEAYDTAGEHAIRGGIGFIRVDHDYISDDSFLQELKIKSVKNPLAVYIDPNSVESDGSDAEWAVILDEISKDDFAKLYPDREFISFESADGFRANKDDVIIIAEFFIKEYSIIYKQLNDNGELVEVVEKDKEKPSRDLKKVTIKRYKFNGESTPLNETIFPGKYIPVIPVYGEEVWVDGKRTLLSLIRQSKDAQRRLNHWASKESEILTLAPISPIMAAVGQVDDFDEWTDPDDAKVLRYKQTDAEGNSAPMPQRLAPPPIPTGIINAMQGAKENIKETMGLYNASIGNRSNETSGIAINARKVEGEVATYHFADNRNRSIAQVGRVLVSAIPEIYDTDRVEQIIGNEDNIMPIGINGAPLQEGQERDYDLRIGQYDVRVTTGISYTTKRQETAALMGEILKANPNLLNVIGDLYFKNLDIAGAEAIAERVKKTIPPQLIEGEKGEETDIEKQQMRAVIQELQAQLQQATQILQEKENNSALEVVNKKTEIEIKNKELQLKQAEILLKAENEAKKLENEKLKLLQEQEKILLEKQKLTMGLDGYNEKGEKIEDNEDDILEEANNEELEKVEKDNEKKLKIMEQEARLLQANEIINALSSISNQLSNLTNQVAQPIEVLRDEQGNIVGAK